MKAAYKYQAEDVDELNFEVMMHTISTNVRLEFVEPSARKGIYFLDYGREKRVGERVGRGEHSSKLARPETASKLNKLMTLTCLNLSSSVSTRQKFVDKVDKSADQ